MSKKQWHKTVVYETQVLASTPSDWVLAAYMTVDGAVTSSTARWATVGLAAWKAGLIISQHHISPDRLRVVKVVTKTRTEIADIPIPEDIPAPPPRYLD